MSLKPWRVVHSEYVIEDKWVTLRADRCVTDRGVIIDPYYVHESVDWVHVLALNPANEVLVTRQYRHGIGNVVVELPAGCIDAGESPETAMIRELLEETGCQASRFEELPALSPNPARFDNTVHHFVAFDVIQVAVPQQDATEHIEFEFVPVEQLLGMIGRGEFSAALHIPTVFLGLQRAGLFPISSQTAHGG